MRFAPRAFAKAADRMRRRDFIALVGSAAAWIVPARAQAMPVIGYLGSESPERYGSRLSAFREGPGGSRLRRGAQRRDRVSMGGRSI